MLLLGAESYIRGQTGLSQCFVTQWTGEIRLFLFLYVTVSFGECHGFLWWVSWFLVLPNFRVKGQSCCKFRQKGHRLNIQLYFSYFNIVVGKTYTIRLLPLQDVAENNIFDIFPITSSTSVKSSSLKKNTVPLWKLLSNISTRFSNRYGPYGDFTSSLNTSRRE